MKEFLSKYSSTVEIAHSSISHYQGSTFYFRRYEHTSVSYQNNRHAYFEIYLSRTTKKAPWLWSASELYRPSYRLFSAKLMPAFADRGCRKVSTKVACITKETRFFSLPLFHTTILP
jgi:hypothetical protein